VSAAQATNTSIDPEGTRPGSLMEHPFQDASLPFRRSVDSRAEGPSISFSDRSGRKETRVLNVITNRVHTSSSRNIHTLQSIRPEALVHVPDGRS